MTDHSLAMRLESDALGNQCYICSCGLPMRSRFAHFEHKGRSGLRTARRAMTEREMEYHNLDFKCVQQGPDAQYGPAWRYWEATDGYGRLWTWDSRERKFWMYE